MARVFTPQDAQALLAATVREATGQELTLQQINASNWVSIGEQLLTTGKENVLNALSTVLFRELIAVRPYSGKFLTFRSKNNSLYQQMQDIVINQDVSQFVIAWRKSFGLSRDGVNIPPLHPVYGMPDLENLQGVLP